MNTEITRTVEDHLIIADVRNTYDTASDNDVQVLAWVAQERYTPMAFNSRTAKLVQIYERFLAVN